MEKKTLQKKIVDICKRCIKLSFAVVSDYHLEEQDKVNSEAVNNATLNVNGGCLGANTSFGGLGVGGDDEKNSRIGIQRIVVGCWLLAKEAASLLATCIVSMGSLHDDDNDNENDNDDDYELVDSAGAILLTTLQTLKHMGVAFSCQKALQKISEFCFSADKLSNLPGKWSEKLVDSISNKLTVHESTLRRSSGYAFGFLSILGALAKSKKVVTASVMFPKVLRVLIKLALPSASEMEKVKIGLGLPKFCFVAFGGGGEVGDFVKDDEYDWKCRVHALNILRLMLLDATLAAEMVLYASDAIMAAIIGFDDGTWAVESSTTMVYTAAMLRVIDVDKNASGSDLGGGGGEGGGGGGGGGGGAGGGVTSFTNVMLTCGGA